MEHKSSLGIIWAAIYDPKAKNNSLYIIATTNNLVQYVFGEWVQWFSNATNLHLAIGKGKVNASGASTPSLLCITFLWGKKNSMCRFIKFRQWIIHHCYQSRAVKEKKNDKK